MLTYFTNASPWERQRHFESIRGRQWIHAMFNGYSKLEFAFSFSLYPDLSTKQWLLPTRFLTLTFTTPRNVSELNILHYGYFTPSSVHFTENKKCWPNAAIIGRVVHNQYRHCIRGSTLERPITFRVSAWNVTSLHLGLEIMPRCNIVNFVNKIKRLFGKYGASNVNEAVFFFASVYEYCSRLISSVHILYGYSKQLRMCSMFPNDQTI